MATVSQILQSKGAGVVTASPDLSVLDALRVMADHNIGALLVVEGDQLAGIFSERDYARKVVLLGKASRDTAVREIMTSDVICVHPGQTADKCMAIMTDKHIRHLPVLDSDDQLVGVVSIGDIVKSIITEQQVMINHLEDYLHS